jgi:hypothetical protein
MRRTPLDESAEAMKRFAPPPLPYFADLAQWHSNSVLALGASLRAAGGASVAPPRDIRVRGPGDRPNAEHALSVFELMTPAEISDVRSGTPILDLAAMLQAAFNDPRDLTIEPGTYLVGAQGITVADVATKRVRFREGAVFKWHHSVRFDAMRRMLSLINCVRMNIDGATLMGANDPAAWIHTEKLIRAGLVENQTGIYMSGCVGVSFEAPRVCNFQWGIYTLATGRVGRTVSTRIERGRLSGNYCGIVWESYLIDGIKQCLVRNTTSDANWKWGMWMEAGSTKDGRFINGISVIGGSFSRQVEEHGCYVQGENHLFEGVSFYANNTAGLRMLACGGLKVRACRFDGNGFNANKIGYSAGGAFIGDETNTLNEHQRSNHVLIERNSFSANRFAFIDYKLDSDVVFARNTCRLNGAPDVEGELTLRSNQNSIVAANSFESTRAAASILVRDHGDAPTRKIEVVGNVITAPRGIGIQLRWGAATQPAEDIHIRANTIRDGAADGVVIEFTRGQAAKVNVEANTVQGCAQAAIRVFVGKSANCQSLAIADNSLTQNGGAGIEYGGSAGGVVTALRELGNIVQGNGAGHVESGGTYIKSSD